jgi:hypothetical protein
LSCCCCCYTQLFVAAVAVWLYHPALSSLLPPPLSLGPSVATCVSSTASEQSPCIYQVSALSSVAAAAAPALSAARLLHSIKPPLDRPPAPPNHPLHARQNCPTAAAFDRPPPRLSFADPSHTTHHSYTYFPRNSSLHSSVQSRWREK